MPDTIGSLHPGLAANAVRLPSGLPLLSTAPLTAVERESLRLSVLALRLTADRLEEALQLNRVDRALDAVQLGTAVGTKLLTLACQLGKGR